VSIIARMTRSNLMISFLNRTNEMYKKRLESFWLRPNFIYQFHPKARILRKNKSSVCNWIIREAKEKTPQQDDQMAKNIFIHRFLKVEDELSDEAIIDQITVFFGAAIETSAISTSNCLLLLAMHPEFQQKVYDEIIRVLPDADNSAITHEKLNELQYLDQVMNETLRLFPVVPIIAREVAEDFEIETGARLVKRTVLVLNFFMLFRCKDVWGDDAEQFNPDRFAPENLQRNQLFIPFSMGKRNCIGYRYAKASFKIAIMKIIRNFELSTVMTFKDIKLERMITLKIAGDQSVTLEKRHQK